MSVIDVVLLGLALYAAYHVLGPQPAAEKLPPGAPRGDAPGVTVQLPGWLLKMGVLRVGLPASAMPPYFAQAPAGFQAELHAALHEGRVRGLEVSHYIGGRPLTPAEVLVRAETRWDEVIYLIAPRRELGLPPLVTEAPTC